MAVVATLSKGYDLDYIWKQVDRGPVKDAVGYYIQASESGGESPGRWWGPGAKALGFEARHLVERGPYDLLFGQRKAPTADPSESLLAAAGKRPTSMPGCWSLSRMPPPSADASCGLRPTARPGRGPCSST